jgi:NADPH:quinone reductase-like Zn-dependent oxidoreductase
MKAIRFSQYGGADVLEYVDLPPPELEPQDVLIEVKNASVNPVDWKIRAGQLEDFFPLKLPAIPGEDGSGIVVYTGAEVKHLKKGDAVCFIASRLGEGSYAELVAVDQNQVIVMPGHLSFAEAAAFPSVGVVAWTVLLETAKIREKMKVLIHAGAGGVGGFTVQLAKHLGAEVAATCHSKDVDYVRDLGADPVIAYDKSDFCKKLKGYDVVLDTIGGDVHRRSYEVLKKGATMVCLNAQPIEDLSKRYGTVTKVIDEKDHGRILKSVTDLVGSGAIKPQVMQVFPLSEAADAQRLSEKGTARGKILLYVGQ